MLIYKGFLFIIFDLYRVYISSFSAPSSSPTVYYRSTPLDLWHSSSERIQCTHFHNILVVNFLKKATCICWLKINPTLDTFLRYISIIDIKWWKVCWGFFLSLFEQFNETTWLIEFLLKVRWIMLSTFEADELACININVFVILLF